MPRRVRLWGPGAKKPGAGASIEWSHPLAVGLAGCWDFLEQSIGSAAIDSTGRYGPAVYTNAPTIAMASQGPCLNLAAASSQYATAGPNSQYSLGTPAKQFTLAIRFRMNNLRDYNGLITKQTGNGQSPCDMYVDSGGTCNILMGGGAVSFGGLVAGVWYTVVVTYRNGTGGVVSPIANSYLDGRLKVNFAYGVQDPVSDANTPVTIGSRGDHATLMNGQIAFARYWTRALTQSEVQLLQTDPYGMYSTRLVPQANSPVVTQTVSPSGVATPFAAGTPTIAGEDTIFPTGVASPFAAGTPTIDTTITISPAGVPSPFAAGTPTILQTSPGAAGHAAAWWWSGPAARMNADAGFLLLVLPEVQPDEPVIA